MKNIVPFLFVLCFLVFGCSDDTVTPDFSNTKSTSQMTADISAGKKFNFASTSVSYSCPVINGTKTIRIIGQGKSDTTIISIQLSFKDNGVSDIDIDGTNATALVSIGSNGTIPESYTANTGKIIYSEKSDSTITATFEFSGNNTTKTKNISVTSGFVEKKYN